MLESEKKSRPFFFGKAAPLIHDVAQQNAVLQQPGVDFSSMTRVELDAYIKKHGDKL